MDKRCSKCGETKPVEEFGKDSKAKDGKFYWCQQCSKKQSLKYYYTHLERSKEVNKEVRARIQADPEKRRRRLDRHSIYYHTNYKLQPRVKDVRHAYYQRRSKNPRFKIDRRMSFQVWYSLKNRLNGKNHKNGKHWEDIVGYSVDVVMRHLESKFSPGMTWDNYGRRDGTGWQIDHIVPKSWFKIAEAGDEEFKKCWALDNLQPMWHLENASKGNRFAGKTESLTALTHC
jgi:hypothetical protein